MKRLKVVLATALLASSFSVLSAPPASASCAGDPVDACAVVCQVGLSNKYTKDLFSFCYIT